MSKHRLSRLVNLPSWLNPKKAIALTAIILALCIPGLVQLQIDPDGTTALLPTQGLLYQEHLEQEMLFGGQSIVTIFLAHPRENWELLRGLHQDLEQKHDMVESVWGLGQNAIYPSSEEYLDEPFGPELSERLGVDFIQLARDYNAFDAFITRGRQEDYVMTYVVAKPGVNVVVFDEWIGKLLDTYRSQEDKEIPLLDLFHIGELAISAEISRLVRKGLSLLAVVVFLMFGVVRTGTKSWRTATLSVMTGVFGVAMTFASMGYAGVLVNPVNSLVVNIIIPLGAAFTIHAHEYARRGGERYWGFLPKASIEPNILAAVTTMVGFGLTSISPVPAIRQFAFGIIGIGACWFATQTMTFPVLALKPIKESALIIGRRRRVAPWWTILPVTCAILAFCYVGNQLVKYDYAPAHYIKKSNPVRQKFERAAELIGTYPIYVDVKLTRENIDAGLDILDPELQQNIDAYARELCQATGSTYTSVFQPVQRMRDVIDADLPLTRELIAQLLLTLELSGTDLNASLDDVDSPSHFRFPVLTQLRSSSDFDDFMCTAHMLASKHKLDCRITGREKRFFDIGQEIGRRNLEQLQIALVIVGGIFLYRLKSVRLAIIASLGNALPVYGSLAFFGFYGILIDLGSSIVSVVSLGLAVDDTSHFTSSFKEHLKSLDPRSAAERALGDVGKAMNVTTVTIVIGFLPLMLSELSPYNDFALSMAFVMTMAWIGDRYIIPSLCAMSYPTWLSPAAEKDKSVVVPPGALPTQAGLIPPTPGPQGP